MFRIAAIYAGMAFLYAPTLPPLLPAAMQALTPVPVIRETKHPHLIPWFTSGFL
jgi:hypothetical protein